MFKNKAMYVRVVDTNTMQPTGEVFAEPASDSIKEILNDIISEEGKQIVKLVITVMAAHFLLSTVSTVIINNTNPPRR